MKFDNLEKDAIVIGDIKSNNVSIDNSNINFIVTILSTNLYSKPIQSFIRETVSNAWDSHVEAGIIEPVVLELGEDTEGNYFCRVQDFGVGLSPERFNSVYKNIGSSTKRGNNEQIGGFGIGRFSALAYSDVVHITSNYEGVKYKYMMYKDGNSISIDLLFEQETDDRNGLEVQLQLKNSSEIAKFYSAIKEQLVYFENLYFVDNTKTSIIPTNEFNEFHIKKYRDFLVNDLDNNGRQIDLVLGKVRYPLRIDSLSNKYPQYLRQYPISLQFEIGQLEVTPNREEILYSQKNIDKIENVLDLAIEELDGIFEEYSNKDFDRLGDYVNALKHSHQAPLLTIDGVDKVYININSNQLKITLKKQKYHKDNFLKIHDYILTLGLIPVSYQLSSGKLIYNSANMSINTLKDFYKDTYFCDISSLNNMSKTYIRETFDYRTKFVYSNKGIKYFYKKYFESIKSYCSKSYNSVTYDYRIVKTIFGFLIENIFNMQRFNDSSVPQSFIDQKKADNKAKRALRKNFGIDWSENVNIFDVIVSARGINSVTTSSTTHSLADIKKKYQKLTVYSDKDDSKLRALFNITLNSKKVNFIEVAPTRQKLLNNFENFVKLEDFMDVKYKLIRQIGTAKLIEETIPYLDKLKRMNLSLGKISKRLQDVVIELSDYTNTYLTNKTTTQGMAVINEIYELCQEKNYFDESMKGVLNAHLDMLKNAESLLLFVDSNGYGHQIPDNRINLTVDYILARKLFRPDVSAVIKMKNETILNIKQDENN